MPVLPPLVSPEELQGMLGDDRLRVFDATAFLRREVDGRPYVIDSGRPSYQNAHIPGASFADIPGELSDPGSPLAFTVPSAEHFATAIGLLGVGDSSHVVAYSQESPMWATRLWWLLRYFGHDAASVLDGGLVAWSAIGGPLESGTRHYIASSFTPKPRPELLARVDDVKEIIQSEGTCLVNALPEEAFRGEGASPGSRRGRIPGSVSVPWSGLVDPQTNRFLSRDRLAIALAAGGIPDDRPVVAYCGGGISATVDVFALSLVGRGDARLYDGSLAEWAADKGLPLVTG